MIINGLILAAGSSQRLGQPKQSVKHKNQSLLEATESKLSSCCDRVSVVLGYQHQNISKELTNSQIFINHDWQQGIGSSLKMGLDHLCAHSDGILVALCDQPLISQQHYQLMIDTFIQHPNSIIASYYNNSHGVPVMFPKQFFNQLKTCPDDEGAKSFIEQHLNHVISLECPAAKFDIDQPQDLNSLTND